MRGVIVMFLAASLWAPVAGAPAAWAGSSATMADPEVYDAVIEESANLCTDWAGRKATPDIRHLSTGVIRAVYDRRVVLCPNDRLPGGGPQVVWYGAHKAMVWNPDARGAAAQMATQLDAMATDDRFPSTLLTWDVAGNPMTQQVVPRFEVNCPSASVQDCLLR